MKRATLWGLAIAFLLGLPSLASAGQHFSANVVVVTGYRHDCHHWRDRDDRRRCRHHREEWREHHHHWRDRDWDRDRDWR